MTSRIPFHNTAADFAEHRQRVLLIGLNSTTVLMAASSLHHSKSPMEAIYDG